MASINLKSWMKKILIRHVKQADFIGPNSPDPNWWLEITLCTLPGSHNTPRPQNSRPVKSGKIQEFDFLIETPHRVAWLRETPFFVAWNRENPFFVAWIREMTSMRDAWKAKISCVNSWKPIFSPWMRETACMRDTWKPKSVHTKIPQRWVIEYWSYISQKTTITRLGDPCMTLPGNNFSTNAHIFFPWANVVLFLNDIATRSFGLSAPHSISKTCR